MPRKVFFSFHYERDNWRVANVRSSNIIHDFDKTPFYDHADWEAIKRRTGGIQTWIDNQLLGSSVTVVLIGNQTYSRPWVKYEIEQSWNRGNGLLGIYIHGMRNNNQEIDAPGRNPFSLIRMPGSTANLDSIVRIYDWVYDNGRENMANWIELAAKQRNK